VLARNSVTCRGFSGSHSASSSTGAAHDFVILVSSMRRNGRSLAEIARSEIGPVAGTTAMIAILFIVVIALAASASRSSTRSPIRRGGRSRSSHDSDRLFVGLYLHKSKAPTQSRSAPPLGALAVLAR